MVFKVPLALLGKKESVVPEVNPDLLACPAPLASVYVPPTLPVLSPPGGVLVSLGRCL